MEHTPESIRQWKSLAAQLKQLKATEINARRSIEGDLFNPNKTGVQHAIVGGVFQLTYNRAMEFSIKKADLMPLIPALTDEEKEAIEWVPKIKVKNYKKLPENSELRKAVSAKLGSPSFEAVDLEVR